MPLLTCVWTRLLHFVAAAFLLPSCSIILLTKAPSEESPKSLKILSSHASLTRSNTLEYTIEGGLAPYSVTSNFGSVLHQGTSGTFRSNLRTGIASLRVTDSTGTSAQINIDVNDNLQAGIPSVANQNLRRQGHSAVSIAGKMYVFGGSTLGDQYISVLLNDVWVFDPSVGAVGSWTQLSPSGMAPSPRSGHKALTINEKMYVFGGNGTSEMWVFDPSVGAQGSWTQLNPSGVPPLAVYDSSVVAIEGKIYVFGGVFGDEFGVTSFNNVWVFDPSEGDQGAWKDLSPSDTKPSPRRQSNAAVIDNKMYIFGGFEGGGPGNPPVYLNDLWVFDPAGGAQGSWTELNPLGTAPETRSGESAVAIGNKMYIYGGTSSSTNFGMNDLWVFDSGEGDQGTWTELNPAGQGPNALTWHSGVVLNDKMFVFGGMYQGVFNELVSQDVNVFDPSSGSGAWTSLNPFPLQNRNYYSATAIDEKIYVYGGYLFNGIGLVYFEDVLVGESRGGKLLSWSHLSPSGPSPGARTRHSAFAIDNKMYIFGGDDEIGLTNAIWVFDPNLGEQGSWKELSPTGAGPEARKLASMVVIAGKAFLFGGRASDGFALNDLWVFDPKIGEQGSWTELSPAGSAPALRSSHSAVVMGDKMYVYGGEDSNYTSSFGDLWVFDPNDGSEGAWRELSPEGSLPAPRYGHNASVVHGKMYIFGRNDAFSDDFFVFDPNMGSDGGWANPIQAAGSKPVFNPDSQSVVIDDKMYVPSLAAFSPFSVFDPLLGLSGEWSLPEYQRLETEFSIKVNEARSSIIQGGVGPFVVTASLGVISVHEGGFHYTAPASAGAATIEVKDALGNSSTISVTITSN